MPLAKHSLYAIIDSASPSAYELQLAFTQDCSGGNVCHYGMVSGFRIKAREANPKGKPVLLLNGITGYFLEAWRGVAQPGMPGGRRAFREGDQRAANTDFMAMDPFSAAYQQLRYWTTTGWRTPRR